MFAWIYHISKDNNQQKSNKKFQAPERQNSASREEEKRDPSPSPLNSRRRSVQVSNFDNLTQSVKDKQEDFDYQKAKFVNIFPLGKGAFSQVFKATIEQTGEEVAIKRMKRDKKIKNRETQILMELDHPNLIKMRHYFIKKRDDEEWLNIVMELVPITFHEYIYKFEVTPLAIKYAVFQLIKGLYHLQNLNIVHRDIKPQNTLWNNDTMVLKICDFGSAKKIVPGEQSISYIGKPSNIGSRFYRAPELIMGSENYSEEIDMWAVGCIFAEAVLKRPIFFSKNNANLLFEIMQIIGSPTEEDIKDMNLQNKCAYEIISVSAKGLGSIVQLDPEGLQLLSDMLKISPKKRIKPLQALSSKYFNDIRREPVCKFTQEEIQNMPQEFRAILVI